MMSIVDSYQKTLCDILEGIDKQYILTFNLEFVSSRTCFPALIVADCQCYSSPVFTPSYSLTIHESFKLFIEIREKINKAAKCC